MQTKFQRKGNNNDVVIMKYEIKDFRKLITLPKSYNII